MPKGIYIRSDKQRQMLREKIAKQRAIDSRIGFKKGVAPKHKFEKKNKFAFQKGDSPWNKGKHGVQSFDYLKAEKNWQWKGDSALYRTKHNWIINNYGRPEKCELCNKDGLVGRSIEWANVSNQYKRVRSDWKRLCVSCHRKYDRRKHGK